MLNNIENPSPEAFEAGTEGIQQQQLDDVTFDPQASIEQVGNFQQAEAIQADLLSVIAANTSVQAGDIAADMPLPTPDGGIGKPGGDAVASIPIQLPDVANGRPGGDAVASIPIQLPDVVDAQPGEDAVASIPIQLPDVLNAQPGGDSVASIPIQLPDVADGKPGGTTVAGIEDRDTVSGQQPQLNEGAFQPAPSGDGGDKENITPINLPNIRNGDFAEKNLIQNPEVDRVVTRTEVAVASGKGQLPSAEDRQLGFTLNCTADGISASLNAHAVLPIPIPDVASGADMPLPLPDQEIGASLPLPLPDVETGADLPQPIPDVAKNAPGIGFADRQPAMDTLSTTGLQGNESMANRPPQAPEGLISPASSGVGAAGQDVGLTPENDQIAMTEVGRVGTGSGAVHNAIQELIRQVQNQKSDSRQELEQQGAGKMNSAEEAINQKESEINAKVSGTYSEPIPDSISGLVDGMLKGIVPGMGNGSFAGGQQGGMGGSGTTGFDAPRPGNSSMPAGNFGSDGTKPEAGDESMRDSGGKTVDQIYNEATDFVKDAYETEGGPTDGDVSGWVGEKLADYFEKTLGSDPLIDILRSVSKDKTGVDSGSGITVTRIPAGDGSGDDDGGYDGSDDDGGDDDGGDDDGGDDDGGDDDGGDDDGGDDDGGDDDGGDDDGGDDDGGDDGGGDEGGGEENSMDGGDGGNDDSGHRVPIFGGGSSTGGKDGDDTGGKEGSVITSAGGGGTGGSGSGGEDDTGGKEGVYLGGGGKIYPDSGGARPIDPIGPAGETAMTDKAATVKEATTKAANLEQDAARAQTHTAKKGAMHTKSSTGKNETDPGNDGELEQE